MSDATKVCPLCGEMILAVAKKCRYCGEYFDPKDRPHEPAPGMMERMVLPVGRSNSAIAAGYLGLFSFFPAIGLAFGILAVYAGVKALSEIGKNPELSGKGRAWFGIIVGAPLALLNLCMLAFLVIGLMIPHR